MAPKKKAASSSSSRKATPSRQPPASKYGIQHFFERHSQSQAASDAKCPADISKPDLNPNPNPVSNSRPNNHPVPSQSNLPSVYLPQQSTTSNSNEKLPQVSPEFTKNSSHINKRFKFSPGLLIKQSQDDGGDEITWKVSPVNQRLRKLNPKHFPRMMSALSDSTGPITSVLHPCMQKQSSSSAAFERLEKCLSSPTAHATGKSSASSSRLLPDAQDVEVRYGNTNTSMDSSSKSFQTPPSTSYDPNELATGMVNTEVLDDLGIGQHCKALLELLDQVEDVVTDESVPSSRILHEKFGDCNGKDEKLCDFNDNKTSASVSHIIDGSLNDEVFLVLEVSEKHHSVDSLQVHNPYKVLRLLHELTGEERVLHLYDEWFYSIIDPGDSVSVVGKFDVDGICAVSHNNNLVIVSPDILVSGTRVASSFNCPRRAVLDERIKSGEHSTSALIGTLLHQIFQAGLLKDLPTRYFLEECAARILQQNIESLYACGADQIGTFTQLLDAIPRIINWINCFRDIEKSAKPVVDFGQSEGQKQVSVIEVMDIEEMAWAPKYGLKGVIDASLRINKVSCTGDSTEAIIPLEFKTGKGTAGQTALEHRAQVILYTLLMSQRYFNMDVDSGLLYYLHTDETKGIKVQRSDLLGIIMRRNELASDILKASVSHVLPPMIKNPMMCKSCRYLSSCTIYHKAYGGNCESSGLGDLYDKNAGHLTLTYIEFIKHWNHLIDLEAKTCQVASKALMRARCLRENNSNCLSSLILDDMNGSLEEGSLENGRYIYHFVHQRTSQDNPEMVVDLSKPSEPSTGSLVCSLRCGDYVLISTENGRLALSNGVICGINESRVSITIYEIRTVPLGDFLITEEDNHYPNRFCSQFITNGSQCILEVGKGAAWGISDVQEDNLLFHPSKVSFARRLRIPGCYHPSKTGGLVRTLWRIDKDEIATSYAVMRFNLMELFVPSLQRSRLRKVIVNLESPRFDCGGVLSSQDPAVSYVLSDSSLNDDQRKAIKKILSAKDYTLVLGMPGTGKTSTMVHAVKALLIRGASILLTSYTNSAVDNLLIKLKAQGIDFIRLGRKDAVHEDIRSHCFPDMHSVDDVRLRMEQVRVVGVTCLGIKHPLLVHKKFDVCIMDEAGQITLPVSLGPLMLATTFVLVGDHYQLPPLVQSTEARENGMAMSLFCRLSEAHPQSISALQCQYRMCAGIMELSNALIYGNRLRCGSHDVANGKLKLSVTEPITWWIKEVIDPDKAVIFINTDKLPGLELREKNNVHNSVEAHIISEIILELLKRGISEEDVGVITPYNSQASLIQSSISACAEVHTIDKYQGRDKDCLLVSFVRSSKNPKSCASSLLGDWRRINVALTRAKKKLIMVGSSGTLSNVPLLKLLIEKVCEQHGLVHIEPGQFKELKKCSHKSV